MSNQRAQTLEHYPVEQLPDDMRKLVPNASRVTVVLTVETEQPASVSQEPKYLRLWGAAAHRDTSPEDAVRRVRELRDEWD